MSKYHTWKQTYPDTKVAVAQYRRSVKFNKYQMNAIVEANGYWRIYLYYDVTWPAKWSISGRAADEQGAITAAEEALVAKAAELANKVIAFQESIERHQDANQDYYEAFFEREVYSKIK